MNYFADKYILIISTEDWSHIPLSKHHYSQELAKIGAWVYFLNPPSGKNGIQKHESISNLFILDYVSIKGVNYMPSILRDFLNRIIIRRIERLSKHPFDVVWSFDPSSFQNLDLFNAVLKIYHPVDVHYVRHEWQIVSSADMIISVAELILKRFSHSKALKVKIDHGLQSHFLQNDNPVKLRSSVSKVGYVGNLDNHCIDIPTMIRIVEENPELIFHFIGPFKKHSPLASKLRLFHHCILIGRVSSEDLPRRFLDVDMFFMCYDGSIKDVNSNHHKILEYLSTGKPVVMNFTDEYNTRRDIVMMADDNRELPDLFKNVLNNYGKYSQKEIVEKRIGFARSNTYQAHVEKISGIVKEKLKK